MCEAITSQSSNVIGDGSGCFFYDIYVIIIPSAPIALLSPSLRPYDLISGCIR